MTKINSKSKKDKQIADLEECLAGHMMCLHLNGGYLPKEMLRWCFTKLKGCKRTPVQVWYDVTGITPE